jgi:Uma2 family endonuclease
MASDARTRATLDDLMRVEGKAELIGGRIVSYPPEGYKPSCLAGEITSSLLDYAERVGRGEVFTGTIAFAVPELPSGRESFSPDVSYYLGPPPSNPMSYVEGPPTLAVEVRGADDYGAAAELIMAAKRADYFAAGTAVVWDVDTLAELIHVYRADTPEPHATYARGQVAEAEPAVPGWRLSVDSLFDE